MVTLSPREQEAHNLLFEQRHQYEDVAEWMGVSVKTVKTFAQRIQKKYRKAGVKLPDNRRHFVTH